MYILKLASLRVATRPKKVKLNNEDLQHWLMVTKIKTNNGDSC